MAKRRTSYPKVRKELSRHVEDWSEIHVPRVYPVK
jgi:hypothetical protein